MSMMTVSDFLFRGFKPCGDGNCIIKRPSGIHTNGGCRRLASMTRSQLARLQGRIQAIRDFQVDIGGNRP